MADSTTTAVSPLRRRMIDDMMLRNLSPATQRSYLHVWLEEQVAKLSRSHDLAKAINYMLHSNQLQPAPISVGQLNLHPIADPRNEAPRIANPTTIIAQVAGSGVLVNSWRVRIVA
jgi:protoheme ferro-lyase